MPIHQDGIGERPQMFGGLEFGRIRRQEEQVDVVGHTQALGAVPARPIQHEHDLLAWCWLPTWRAKAASSASKSGMLTDGRQMKDGASRGGMDEAHQIAPFVAVLHGSEGTLAVDTPDLVQDGLQANAVFVDRPQLDGGVGEGRRHLAQQRAQTRLEGGLRHWVCLDVAWARLEETCAQTAVRRAKPLDD